MTIYAMHGVVRGASGDLSAHRNMIDEESFLSHLAGRPPYVSVDHALRGEGDALTIDDATEAAGRAAELARQRGHEVELFINPYHVESAAPYFFAILNAALDDSSVSVFSLDERQYDMTTRQGRRRARQAIKHRILGHASEERRVDLARTIAADLLQGRPLSIPPHLATLSAERLRQLVDMGVTVGNHGWTHGHLSRLDTAECEHEIKAGATWIKEHVGVSLTHFAVPFGDFVPDWKTSPLYRMYLLCTDVLNEGMVGPQIANRVTLRL